MNTTIFLGPPGTGKTTRLLRVLEESFEAGINPAEIAYCSFTRAACNEARDRARERFKLSKKDMHWFNTIHGVALGNSIHTRRDILDNVDKKVLAKTLGMFFKMNSGEWKRSRDDEDDVLSMASNPLFSDDRRTSIGEKLMSIHTLSKAKGIPARKIFETIDDPALSFAQYNAFETVYERHKREFGKIDYSDMLQAGIDSGPIAEIKIAIIDEAQDLTPLQWQAVDALFGGAEHRYIAGDDDQAIYKWSGADVETFLSLEGEREVLFASHRLPKKVHELACHISSRIKHRYAKTWTHNGKSGSVATVGAFSKIDMSKGTGTWLVLGRTNHALEQPMNDIRQNGFPFTYKGSSSINPKVWSAIVAWESVRRPLEPDQVRFRPNFYPTIGLTAERFPTWRGIPQSAAANIYALMNYSKTNKSRGFGYGGKKAIASADPDRFFDYDTLKKEFGMQCDPRVAWFDALARIPDEEREYLRACRKGGEIHSVDGVVGDPRIRVDTFHGSKGAEADNVVVFADMTAACWSNYTKNPDDELRALYVAVTRSKKNLFIVSPDTALFYRELFDTRH